MDRRWRFVKICSCCKTTSQFTLTHRCLLILDSTCVRCMSLRLNRQECSAWDISSAVSYHKVKNSLMNWWQYYAHMWTFSFFVVAAWNVSISGPDTVSPGRLCKFTCLTSCTLNVDCTVRWQFRQGFPIGSYFSVHENELRWTPSIPGTSQNFTCVAENAAVGRSAEATKLVEVIGTENSRRAPSVLLHV